MLALAAQVNQALRLADSLQRQFQCAPFTGPSAMLEHRVLQLRTQHKKLQMEYDRIMEDAAASLSSPEGKCLTHAFEDLSVEVERVVWYEEDAVAHGCTIAVLQQRNEELEGRAARVEETSDRLRRELDDVSEAFLHAMNDVVSLRNELSELRDAHKLQEDNSAAKIAYWREQTQKWMNTASKEAVSPYNLSKLLTDGDDAVKHKALRRLRAHAERAPQHLVQTKGVLLALVNAACEDQEHAVIAIQALACTAHADYKAHFRYVPNLAERLHSIARDDDKRKAALAPFIKLVAFLTQGHGPGILDCAQERTLFSATLVQLWREIHPSDPLMREVACALAHLTKIDAVGMASPFIAQTLEVYLTRHDKIWGGMLLSLSNLVHLTPVRKLVEGNKALQANLILFIQGKSVYERAVRISASRVLEKLCQAHNGHRLVLSMQPFPHLFAMMRTDDVEEYESCMKVLTLLMSDDGFCHRVMRNDDFALTVISRARTSDIAMFLLTEMTLRCATVLEDRLKQKQKEGAKLEPPDSPFASRNLYLHHLISLDAGLTDTINAHLFTNASPVRRRECMKLVALFSSCQVDPCKVATVFLPGITAFLRAPLAHEEHVLAIAALDQMRSHLPPMFISEHPGMLKSLLRLMAADIPTAAQLLMRLTEPIEGAFAIGVCWGARMALLNMFAYNKAPRIRDAAARALCNVYATEQFDDRSFIQGIPEILKGFVEMWPFKTQLCEPKDQAPNGAVLLARYFHRKPKLESLPTTTKANGKKNKGKKNKQRHVVDDDGGDGDGNVAVEEKDDDACPALEADQPN